MKVRVRVYSNVAPGSTLTNTAMLAAASGAPMVVTETTRVINFPPTPTPTASPLPSVTPIAQCGLDPVIRVDAGSGITYTDSSGAVWLPDRKYMPITTTWGYTASGFAYTTNTAINGTLDPALYQSERWWEGNGGYRFALPNGRYQVRLSFAEIYQYAAPGSRVFSVKVEGATVLAHLDVAKTVGRYSPYDVSIDTLVQDGVLNIDFVREVGNPALKAVAIFAPRPCAGTPTASPTPRPTDTPTATATSTPTATPTVPSVPGSPTPTPTATATQQAFSLAVNVGGPAVAGSGGVQWQADRPFTNGGWGYVGGEVYANNSAISDTTDDAIYQNERWWNGTGSYKFTVPNGAYVVEIKLAEVYPWTTGGGRVFDIRAEGIILSTGIDVVSAVGHFRAYDITLPGIVVTDGVLNLDFISRQGTAMVNAIRIRQ
jgi:hypothetical protein